MEKLTYYEDEQKKEISKWKNQEPSVVSQSLSTILSPLNWLVSKVIPVSAIEGALGMALTSAEWLTDIDDVKSWAKIDKIKELKSKDLKLSDEIANSVHNWALGITIAEGAASGAVGLYGLAVDIPFTITFALRTINKIGVCYGYESNSKEDRDYILGILAASGANTMEEKSSSILLLKSIENTLATQTWKKIAESTGIKDMGIIAIKQLAQQLGINLTKRKALQAIPIIGAAVGGSVNYWYLDEVSWAARRCFQERWLKDNNKIIRE